MKKTGKVQLLAATLSVMAAVTGIVLINNPVQAKAAEETATFAMAKGAAVRAKANEAGIRWETTVNKAWYDEVVSELEEGKTITNYSFGTWVTSANNVSSVTELDETFTNEVKDLPCKVTPNFADETTFTYYSSIVYTAKDLEGYSEDEVKKAYAAELIARSYMKYSTDNGATYTYVYADSNDNARCMRAVALAAYEETDPNKALDADEKEIVNDYFGTENTTAVDFAGYFETAAPDSVNSAYTVAYLGAKKVGTATDGVLTLNGLTLGKKYTLTLFDTNGNYATTEEFQYVTKAVTQESFTTDLKFTANTAGYYALTQDITLSGTWSNAKKFSGTFDGNGFKITGLNGTGLFHTLAGSAVIKNVSIIDANLNSTSGAIATLNNTGKDGTVTIENVYVSLAAQPFSEADVADTTYVATANCYKGGLIGYGATNSNNELVVKNTVVYMPETLTTACGFVYGYSRNVNAEGGNVTTENCTFIGGNGQAFGLNTSYSAATVTNTNSVYCDAVAAHETYKANWSEMQKTAYNKNHEYVKLGNADFENYFKEATDQIIVLTEDVTLTTAYMKAAKATFTGVLDGNGKKINGMTAATKNAGGLVNTLNGSIKNVAIIGAGVSAKTGLIAETISQNAYLENVYIEVTTLVASANGGVVARYISPNVGLSFKNVVIYAHGTGIDASSCAVMGFAFKPITIKTENLVYIHPTENVSPMYGNDANANCVSSEGTKYFFQTGTQGFTGASAITDLTTAVANGQVKFSSQFITDFITSIINQA